MNISPSSLFLCVQWRTLSFLGHKQIHLLKYELMRSLRWSANNYGIAVNCVDNPPHPFLFLMELRNTEMLYPAIEYPFSGPNSRSTELKLQSFSWKRGSGFVMLNPPEMQFYAPDHPIHPFLADWLECLSQFNRAYEDDLVLDISLKTTIREMILTLPSLNRMSIAALTA